MDWFENLRDLKAKSNMSMREIAIKSGIPEPTLEKIFSGATKSPGVNTIQSLVHALGYTLNDIDSGSNKKNAPPYSSEAMKLAKDYDGLDKHGQKIVRLVADEELARCTEQAQAISLQEPAEIIYTVPGYTLPMSAGLGEPAGQEPPEDFALKKAPPRGTSYIARVHGRSMEPSFYDGELVFVHASEEIPAGQIGVFYMDGQQWVKELGEGELISHAPGYAPRPMTEDVRCQGLVLGVCDESYFV